ncbi:SH3 domain-containing protein [Xylaria bambusicola]|uniref:SH3 domain-containing protein n=1 Tax=Xylaria bambusicola TaxID=326684 RepID=UPI00200785A3|nr:SH3 domain-containing protein [Xylaria bambusicola]KAI0517322.1 SH3 domain-containing protein [Xylaria bambusicola]
MPWRPLPRIAFAVATYPFETKVENELPLEIGDDLYIIEETLDGEWLRGYLLAPPSLLAGLTSVKGQTLEARVFSGIFPRSCVEIREVLGEGETTELQNGSAFLQRSGSDQDASQRYSDSGKSGIASTNGKRDIGVDGNTAKGQSQSQLERESTKLTKLSRIVGTNSAFQKPPAPVPFLRMGDESPASINEPLIDEIASCLREWHSTNFHELLLTRQYTKLESVSQLIQTIDLARRQLLHSLLTDREAAALRVKTVWDLVRGNKLCGGEVIVRDPAQRGKVLVGDDSVIEITRLQSAMSLLDEPPLPHVESMSLHHFMVDVKSFAGSSNEPATLDLYLVTKSVGGSLTTLTETFTAEVPSGGIIGYAPRDSQMRTLFTDLTSADIGEGPSMDSEFYLVVKVRAPQQIIAGKPSSRSGSFGQSTPSFSKDKPPSSAGPKTSRRSLMWGSTRSAFSRGGLKLDALSEHPNERLQSNGNVSTRDGIAPPSTAGSVSGRTSMEGPQQVQIAANRLVGVGVLNLKSIMKEGEESEQVVTIWSPSSVASPEPLETSKGWDDLIRDALDSESGHYENSRRAERLLIHFKSFDHPDADILIKSTPTLLSGIDKTNKMGFSGAPTKPRSDIYITINEALLARQNLISRYGGSATSISSNMLGNNLVVSVNVRRQSGERIDSCIFPSSNSQPYTTWTSFAVQRGERWSQTLRLSLSPPDVTTSHVVLTVSELPNTPFAMAYLPLWDHQAFMSDGLHSLLLYRVDEHTQSAQPDSMGRGGYLSLPWSARTDSSEVTGPLAVLRVETYLCSTRFSQDRTVLSLLKWRDGPKSEVSTLLRQLIFVPEIEVVKLLNDVLDALFSILVEYQGNDEFEDLVFTALVRVLGIVHDRRFNVSPLVDLYAENIFNYPFATPCLVRSFTRLLTKPTEPETARKLRATLKVVRHILKFITHARGQQKAKEAGIGITGSTPGFTRHLQSIFKALDSMMRSTAPVLVGSQTLAVQHFHTWLPELAGLLTTEEILHIAIDFMDSCALVKGKLVLYKLILIINYSKLDLFSQPEQRSALSANTVRWIAPHWGQTDEVTQQWRDQVRLCCSVLASQIPYLNSEIPDYIPKIVDSFLAIQSSEQKPKDRFSFLFPTSYPFPSKPLPGDPVKFDEALIELSTLLSASSSSPNGMQLELSVDDITAVLKNTLQVHLSILQGEAFPSNWLSVYTYHHKSTMKMLQYLAGILLDSALPHPDDAEDFDTELWRLFFMTLLKLVGSGCLALETFPEQKRRAVWKIAGDVREHGAELLRRTWEAVGWDTSADERMRYGLSKMGGYQVQYVPSLVGPIVQLCLSVHGGLRKVAVEVLQTMIVSEWTLSEDLSVIQTELIDCLDKFFKDQAMTESIMQKLFISELLECFNPLSRIENDPLYASIRELIDTLDVFLDLLVAAHTGDINGEASSLMNRLELMEFLRDMHKEDIFIRYVHHLATLQRGIGYHTEAGLALRLHADLYDWDPTTLTPALPEPPFPEQSHFERKEHLYFEMIKHFEDGEAWSSALAAYNELREQYESNIFDFAKLARTERAIATIYETLAKGNRLLPKYFKVVFKGLGFPPNIRDKAYVYEGSHRERATAFTDRMQEQYQAAHILTNGDVDSEVEGQYLIVSAVSPHRDLRHQVFQRGRVAQPIRDFLLSSNPQTFSVSSKRNTSGPVEEHYAEKIVYTTSEAFPTILRRSEIIEVEHIRLNAKETALERIVRKTQEMTAVERQLADNGGNNDLAQLMVGAISVSVLPESESSVACYRKLLPVVDLEDPDEMKPELSNQENAIRTALIDHAIMIKRSLTSFVGSSNQILAKGYQDLYPHFISTFAPEIAIFAPPQPQGDAIPGSSLGWQRSSPTRESGQFKGNIRTSLTNGTAIVEEASTVQPIVMRQHGSRLSFLGGKPKSSQQSGGENSGSTLMVGDGSESNSQYSKENLGRVLRTQSIDTSSSTNHHYRSSVDAGPLASVSDRSRKSREIAEFPEGDFSRGEGGVLRINSVRKRLSILKLGKKPSRSNGIMGGLSEEQ